MDAEVRALEDMFSKAAKARKPHDVEWVLDAAFYLGKQYTEYYKPQNQPGQFRTIPRDPNNKKAPRPIANKIYSKVMDAYASMATHDPAIESLPQNIDSVSIATAKLEQAYLDHVSFPTQANWLLRRNKTLFWVALCGEGWFKACMRPDNSRPDIETCSPFEIYLPPGVTAYVDAPWIIHARAMDPEDVFERYGIELPASSLDAGDATKNAILREIGMLTGTQTVLVKELWQLPCRRHPRGRMAAWGGGRLLYSDPHGFPYAHGQLPFMQVGHSPVPGTPHFTSGTRVMRPLQMELNDYHAQKTTNRKKFNNHKWFMDAALAESMTMRPDDSANQLLIGDSRNGLLLPQILQGQVWPDSQDGAWITSEMDDAVGLHEASQGSAPGRVDSAQGIESLQEADRSRLVEVEGTMETAIALLFGQLLSLAKQYVKDEQIIQAYSGDSRGLVHRFKTDQFPAKPIVRVVSGGGLPKNRASRRAEIISMWSAGLLGADPGKALKMLDYPTDMNLSGIELDQLEAQNENMQLAEGVSITAKKWQNHELHRRVHDEQRKTSEFQSATNDVQAKYQFHMDTHDAAELEEIQEEAARRARIEAIAAAAAPPEAPVGGEPTAAQPTGQVPQPGAPPA